MIRFRVASLTAGEPFKARETVATETPDFAASCWIVVISETFPFVDGGRRNRFRKICQGPCERMRRGTARQEGRDRHRRRRRDRARDCRPLRGGRTPPAGPPTLPRG